MITKCQVKSFARIDVPNKQHFAGETVELAGTFFKDLKNDRMRPDNMFFDGRVMMFKDALV